jgi:hypothetical protein
MMFAENWVNLSFSETLVNTQYLALKSTFLYNNKINVDYQWLLTSS